MSARRDLIGIEGEVPTETCLRAAGQRGPRGADVGTVYRVGGGSVSHSIDQNCYGSHGGVIGSSPANNRQRPCYGRGKVGIDVHRNVTRALVRCRKRGALTSALAVCRRGRHGEQIG